MPSLPPSVSGLPPDTARHVLDHWTAVQQQSPPGSAVTSTPRADPSSSLPQLVQQATRALVIGRLLALLFGLVLFLFFLFFLA